MSSFAFSRLVRRAHRHVEGLGTHRQLSSAHMWTSQNRGLSLSATLSRARHANACTLKTNGVRFASTTPSNSGGGGSGDAPKNRNANTNKSVTSPNDNSAIMDATSNNAVSPVPGVPSRATAGLSETSLAEWRDRVSKGAALETVWENPGAYGQLDRVNAVTISALPPPPRPQWPQSEWSYTFRYLRAFALVMVFAGLAVYIQAKNRLTDSVRWKLHQKSPWLACLFGKVGLMPDVSASEAVDTQLLFRRIYRKYADSTPVTSTGVASSLRGELGIPASRAVALAMALAGDASADAKMPPHLQNALAATKLANKPLWSEEDFVSFMSAAFQDVSKGIIALGAAEIFAVAYASSDIMSAFEELYHKLMTLRDGKDAFTAKQLAEISSDIGFMVEETDVMAFLQHCGSATDSMQAHTPVKITAREFVDFMCYTARKARVSESRIPDYLRVYLMLHASGIKQAAGIPELK